eukprot:ANDGO_05739.mRNA.1 Crystal protein
MKHAKRLAVFCLFSLMLLCSIDMSTAADDHIVQTTAGPVRGTTGPGYVRWSVPYGEPPVQGLRWRPPVARSSWAPSVFDGTQFLDGCPRLFASGSVSGSEDCLNLVIWAPTDYAAKSYPVLWWVHGGGFTGGSAKYLSYHGDFLVNSTKGMVVVTVNYRLGVLGWLASPGLFEGNYGFMDQLLSLQWVQENIRNFGGDPTRVTIDGQSAGGISVGLHLVSPASRGLFHQAIIQSNPFAMRFRTGEENLGMNELLAIRLGCSTIRDRSCLYNKTVDEVLVAQQKDLWLPDPLDFRDELPFQPTLDGRLVPGQPLELLEGGQGLDIPIIMGDVKNETLGWVYEDPVGLPKISWAFMLDLLTSNRSEVQEILNIYGATEDSRVVLSRASADFFFNCATRRALLALSRYNKAPLRWYAFLHSPQYDPENKAPQCSPFGLGGVCHGADLVYVFHTLSEWNHHFTPEEEVLSSTMMNLWADFVSGSDTLSFAWPLFSADTTDMLAFDTNGVFVLQNHQQMECQLWDQLGY